MPLASLSERLALPLSVTSDLAEILKKDAPFADTLKQMVAMAIKSRLTQYLFGGAGVAGTVAGAASAATGAAGQAGINGH